MLAVMRPKLLLHDNNGVCVGLSRMQTVYTVYIMHKTLSCSPLRLLRRLVHLWLAVQFSNCIGKGQLWYVGGHGAYMCCSQVYLVPTY